MSGISQLLATPVHLGGVRPCHCTAGSLSPGRLFYSIRDSKQSCMSLGIYTRTNAERSGIHRLRGEFFIRPKVPSSSPPPSPLIASERADVGSGGGQQWYINRELFVGFKQSSKDIIVCFAVVSSYISVIPILYIVVRLPGPFGVFFCGVFIQYCIIQLHHIVTCAGWLQRWKLRSQATLKKK